MQILPGRGLWAENGSNISSYPIDRVQSNQNTRLETKTTGNPNLITDSQLTSNVSSITNSSGTSTRTLQGPQSNSSPQTSASTAVSLPAVLKDIAVNPTLIMHWFQMEQQKRSASEPQQKVNASSGMSSGMIGNVTAGMVIPPGNAPKTAEVGQIPSVRPQVPMQTAPVVKFLILHLRLCLILVTLSIYLILTSISLFGTIFVMHIKGREMNLNLGCSF